MKPSPWRRHWKFVVGYLVAVGVIVGAFGAYRVHAYSSSPRADHDPLATDNLRGRRDLFDPTSVHELAIEYRQADYDAMLATYFKDGTKEFMQADLTIDGVSIPAVGIRLKGNATLRNLRGADGQTAPGFPLPGGGQPVGAPVGAPVGGFGGGGFGTSLSIDRPEALPWLISIDEFVKGRRYQGHRELAVRPAQNITQNTVLNEALSLSMMAAAGEPASSFTYSTLQVNGGEPVLRLVLQNPDESLAADEIESGGVIYKSLSTGSLAYRGDDPLAYATSFRQMNRKNEQDLKPLISFIKWVNEADDIHFRDELPNWLDVESFAKYCAFQNLLLNFDDMAGPGQNYLLLYDLESETFRVGTWDMNISFSGNATQGPYETGGFGRTPAGAGGVGQPGSLPRGGNKLKERFLASGTYRKVYERVYRELYQTFYVGGGADAELDAIAAMLATVPADVLDPAKATADVDQLRTAIKARTAGLSAHAVITG